jgi:hypothetical protein
MRDGYIYVLICTEHNWYKIGMTRVFDFRKRVRAIQQGVPFELDQIHAWNTNKTKALENYLKETLKHRRIRGEWFNLTDSNWLWLHTHLDRLPDSERMDPNADGPPAAAKGFNRYGYR